ncbi:MAG: hypothetical protein IPJ65_25390 [Archangiaceae bacterium]|nr:hypothetical protein [Archangiaceae bacterium]
MTVVLGIAAMALGLACGGSQTQPCRDYLACYYRLGGTPRSLDSTYGENGSCWTSPSSTDVCIEQCKSALDLLKTSGVAADAGCTFQ